MNARTTYRPASRRPLPVRPVLPLTVVTILMVAVFAALLGLAIVAFLSTGQTTDGLTTEDACRIFGLTKACR